MVDVLVDPGAVFGRLLVDLCFFDDVFVDFLVDLLVDLGGRF